MLALLLITVTREHEDERRVQRDNVGKGELPCMAG